MSLIVNGILWKKGTITQLTKEGLNLKKNNPELHISIEDKKGYNIHYFF